MTTNASEFERARKVLVGGVNSAVRAFRAVGGTPRFIARAEGAYMWDVEGRRYIDYLGSWGPMIVGQSHPHVVKAVKEAAERGLSYGAPNVMESELAERICALFPQVERVRFTSSGTEAAMSALRLARGYTKRNKIIKFEGCYHGTADSLLVKAGSGALAFGTPSSAGVPEDLAKHTLVAQFNDLASVEAFFREYPQEIACVMVEPIAGNMNLIRPAPGFHEGLRELCTEHGALLIFDEVMTGFRVALGGAQQRYGITPDLSTFGKIIGGGMPVGAYGGRADLMRQIAPSGPIYQAGTLSGNPVAMAAGLATLELIQAPGFHQALEQRTNQLCDGLEQAARDAGVPVTTNRSCAMFGLFFTDRKVESFADAIACDTQAFNRFFHGMRKRGVYLAPSAYEAGFISAAHGDAEISHTIEAAHEAFREARG